MKLLININEKRYALLLSLIILTYNKLKLAIFLIKI